MTIPALDIDAPVIEVGQLENGQMGVPDNGEDVGWYEPGTQPGGAGNAVLAGHVDDRTGPAVFFDLGDLEPGDQIFVTGEDGEELEFIVDGMERYPFDDSPVEEIFGPSDDKQLNLITCTGVFNQENGTHEERLVVYTSLVEEEEEPVLPVPTELTIQGDLLSWHSVRDEEIVGYRIYEIDAEGEETHVGSVSQLERKSFLVNDQDTDYTVKAVDHFGNESDPAEEEDA
ncbi:hypothetical protein JCM19037_403 [Geomicrobium sp. JCM 19037]|uniref:class F sortase n=1 Tax=Geomicrobium sp. JCM 19037 TaxID=1460634 RepID=UPI00045F3B3E|nr:class F sortase [Geomicrobium sp. JCM 19037]GAK02186.1 hypothetical protein JCM19037_403 [Geomicrobium sp. JCM 19037]